MSRLHYEVLSLRVRGTVEGFELELESPAGEGTARFAIPAEVSSWMENAGPVQNGQLRDLSRMRATSPLPTLAEELRNAGRALFRAAFPKELDGLLHASLGRLRSEDEGLRIQIEIDPRGQGATLLQMLPWELLCLPQTEDFLALSRRTPIIRFLRIPRQRTIPIPNPRTMRILCVGDNSLDLDHLDLAKERDNLRAAWNGKRRKVEIDFRNRCTLSEIRRAFLEDSFHVLHFMGHGQLDPESGRGLLVLTNKDGTPLPVDGSSLAEEIADFNSTLRLVVLNACHTAASPNGADAVPFTDVASALVMSGVPAVVAMRGPVSDRGAIAFSRSFFESLADDQPVDASLAEARKAIRREQYGEEEWLLPALFLRQADGYLFRPPGPSWKRALIFSTILVFLLAAVVLLGRRLRAMEDRSEAQRWSALGRAAFETGDVAAAFDAFSHAVALVPENPELLNHISMAEERLGKLESALEHAQAAALLAESGADAAAYQYNLGALLSKARREEEALHAFQRALDLDPKLVPAYNEMGNVFLKLKRSSDARQAYRQGLAVDPAFPQLVKNLARVELEEGDLEAAVELLSEARMLYPLGDWRGRAECAYLLALAESLRSRADQACRALEQFFEAAPSHLSEFDLEAQDLARRLSCSGS